MSRFSSPPDGLGVLHRVDFEAPSVEQIQPRRVYGRSIPKAATLWRWFSVRADVVFILAVSPL